MRGLAGRERAGAAMLALLGGAAVAGAEDVRVVVPLEALEILEGSLESRTAPWAIRWSGDRELLLEPHVALSTPGEAFVADLRNERKWEIQLAVRGPAGGRVEGRLIAPSLGAEPRVDVRFRVALGAEDDPDAWNALASRRARRRWEADLPGSAVFRVTAGTRADGIEAYEASFSPFAPVRRTSERLLAHHFRDPAEVPARPGPGTIPVDPPLASSPWCALGADAPPVSDPLLHLVPHDQPVIVFPSLDAALAVLGEADLVGTPLLRLVEGDSIETHVRDVLEAELCLPTRRLEHDLPAGTIRSVAVTSSDASLREGADVTVLFETRDPAPLLLWLEERHADARHVVPSAVEASGEGDGARWFTLRDPARTVDSTVVASAGVVAVTNSPVQVAALADVRAGLRPSLGDRPEVRFLRARYPRGAPGESALLIVSEPTFRRWTGAEWRIRASRRTRAAAALADRAARAGSSEDAPPLDARGRVARLSAVAEFEATDVTESEFRLARAAALAQAEAWVTSPALGARIDVSEGRLRVDASATPLALLPRALRARRLAVPPDAGPPVDVPRAGTILQALLAIDLEGANGGDPLVAAREAFVRLCQHVHPVAFFSNLAVGAVVDTPSFDWLAGPVALSLDADPLWEALGQTDDAWGFLEEHFSSLPVSVTFAVRDDEAAELFLEGARATCRRLLSYDYDWEVVARESGRLHRITESREHRDRRIAPREWSPLALHLVQRDGRLVVTPNERLAFRALEIAAERSAEEDGWRGESLAVRLDRRALDAIQTWTGVWFEEARQTASWRHLPILNEWRRRFPDEDPVAVHWRRFAQELVCPGGGACVWNPADGTMESTAYGSPVSPRLAPEMPSLIESIESASAGVTFEEDALRARLDLRWR